MKVRNRRMQFAGKLFLLLLFINNCLSSRSQPFSQAAIYSKTTLESERVKRRDGLYKYTILPLLQLQPDSLNQYRYQTALWNMSQYMLRNDTTRRVVNMLFNYYNILESSTRRSLMEVVYGLYPTEYIKTIQQLLTAENDDRLVAIMSFYLKRQGKLDETIVLKKLMQNQPHYDSSAILQQLDHTLFTKQTSILPPLADLFQYQSALGCKVIYSLQRTNRNYPGLVIMQNADGSFVKDSTTGALKTFVQLARSAADLPYFITNGNTPQGAYRIHGTAVSYNNAIGPTPNMQLNVPFEVAGDSFFIHPTQPILDDTSYLTDYKKLFPASWQTEAMMESFYAGKCGRGAIIAHGTTLDPIYFQQQSFFPCMPTLGCLCAKETWNPASGRLVQSDQLDMVNTFLSTPGVDGYLFVINLDDQQKAVTPEDATALVKSFEVNLK